MALAREAVPRYPRRDLHGEIDSLPVLRRRAPSADGGRVDLRRGASDAGTVLQARRAHRPRRGHRGRSFGAVRRHRPRLLPHRGRGRPGDPAARRRRPRRRREAEARPPVRREPRSPREGPVAERDPGPRHDRRRQGEAHARRSARDLRRAAGAVEGPRRARQPGTAGPGVLSVRTLIAFLALSSAAAAQVTVTGTVTYEDRTYDINGFNGIAPLPVRQAEIELLRASDSALLASGVTNDTGAYSLSFGGPDQDVRIRVFARRSDGKINAVVKNNTSLNQTYAVSSAVFNSQSTPVLDMLITRLSGAGGAFNIFDCAVKTFQYLASIEPA